MSLFHWKYFHQIAGFLGSLYHHHLTYFHQIVEYSGSIMYIFVQPSRQCRHPKRRRRAFPPQLPVSLVHGWQSGKSVVCGETGDLFVVYFPVTRLDWLSRLSVSPVLVFELGAWFVVIIFRGGHICPLQDIQDTESECLHSWTAIHMDAIIYSCIFLY